MPVQLAVVGLFAGVGGIERGLDMAGARSVMLSESWDPAMTVLRDKFPEAQLVGDMTELSSLPACDLVTAGFPCTDISQAGRTAGIAGAASGLVHKALDLIRVSRPKWVLLENVPNLLHLSRGRAIDEITRQLEDMGYDWAYRIIDSRAFGVAQRRRRVFLLASIVGDPASVLLGEDSGQPDPRYWRTDAYGFSWTEGNRGVGWAQDAVPTLKGSTTASIPSPPGIWLPRNQAGSQIVKPTIEAAEVLQGFPAGWTSAAPPRDRWKLVGNAVTSHITKWLGERLIANTRDCVDGLSRVPLRQEERWPRAAYCSNGKRWRVDVSEWPVRERYVHLATVLSHQGFEPLSERATRGFRTRLARSNLRYDQDFFAALVAHEAAIANSAKHP
jgi:DNA (cytosine-5)-methyltransferase 1